VIVVEGLGDLNADVQQALERDPLYADAYSGIADSYNLLGYYNERPPK